jgi:class 3 adenylate cyclase/tetratricopeptide (TPR) repeat protein
VQHCPHCGEENPDRFRLCGFCGASLSVAHQPLETRKTVTIVFCDLQGSTSLGERLDTESLREVLSHYFKEMRRVLERHGGVVEKYIGDAIMAVFGLPRVHEDDALRAVRAAAEMQQTLAAVNEELERRWGVRLANRTGVNTGEVISGDVTTGQRLVTGDAVNVAARLEQAAPEFEVLLGGTTYRLVKNAVEVKQLEPLQLKGKSEPVAAYQLISVSRDEAFARRLDAPLVGRTTEAAVLQETFDRTLRERTGHLLTVLGDAGVGKSRLILELVTQVAGQAMCLRGRCLPYGEGITFLPLADVVRQAAGIGEGEGPDQARAKLSELVDPEVFVRVAAAIGLSSDTFPLEETFWGARKLLEMLGRRRPLLVVIEDIHWAEPTFLDLIENLVDSIQDAPVLVLCSARHDLLDQRPAWGQAIGALSIALQPLTEEESGSIVSNLLGDAPIPQRFRTRIVKTADGNPLFVEQILSMLMDEGLIARGSDGRWRLERELASFEIPPSIAALLTARLDRLAPEERSAIERGSVMGPLFYRGAVTALSPEPFKPTVALSLAELTRKQMIRPDASAIPAEDAFRFHHILIRDAAYKGLLKRARIELHERLAEWLETAAVTLMEYEELVGYHLEQSYLYRTELGTVDDEASEVGRRAAQRLAAAGTRAFARGDMPAAANMFTRAIALLPRDDPMRLMLIPDLGEALKDIGEFGRADELLKEAIEGAQRAEDRRLEVDAMVVRLLVRYAAEAGARIEDLLREAQRAILALDEKGSEAILARAWRLVGVLHGTAGRYGAAEEAVLRAIRYAGLAGDRRQETRNLPIYAACTLYGSTPIPEAIAHCEQLLEQASDDQRGRSLVRLALAQLHAMQGDFEQARKLYTQSRAILTDLGEKVQAASTSIDSGRVEMLAEDPVAAEVELRRDYEALDGMGEKYFLATTAALLAHALYLQDRYEEAEAFSRVSGESDQDDVETQSLWRRARAKVLARWGRFDEAEQLAREALTMIEQTDSPILQANTLMDLAEVLRVSGKLVKAVPLMRAALALYERKGNVVSAARTRAAIEDLAAVSVEAFDQAPRTLSPR